MFTSMLLDCMTLEMPTMSIKTTLNEDQDAEEEVHIKFQPIREICHARHIINIENEKLPLTLSLIGNDRQYFGIKAVVFNRDKLREDGIFLKVRTEEWRFSDKYISELPKAKKKDKMLNNYILPLVLESNGFGYIFKNLKFNQNKVPFVENTFGEVTKIDAYYKLVNESVEDMLAALEEKE